LQQAFLLVKLGANTLTWKRRIKKQNWSMVAGLNLPYCSCHMGGSDYSIVEEQKEADRTTNGFQLSHDRPVTSEQIYIY
jgi:hypothetical protein